MVLLHAKYTITRRLNDSAARRQVWLALDDADEANGAVQIMKGSHCTRPPGAVKRP
jgi:ectoine hydroxylase-related dioxygenase (phytanoyl-CoA dioxygenase family)